MNAEYKSRLARVIGIDNAIVVPFGFKFPCSQKQYGDKLVYWLFDLDTHLTKMGLVNCEIKATWVASVCTITYAEA